MNDQTNTPTPAEIAVGYALHVQLLDAIFGAVAEVMQSQPGADPQKLPLEPIEIALGMASGELMMRCLRAAREAGDPVPAEQAKAKAKMLAETIAADIADTFVAAKEEGLLA